MLCASLFVLGATTLSSSVVAGASWLSSDPVLLPCRQHRLRALETQLPRGGVTILFINFILFVFVLYLLDIVSDGGERHFRTDGDATAGDDGRSRTFLPCADSTCTDYTMDTQTGCSRIRSERDSRTGTRVTRACCRRVPRLPRGSLIEYRA